MAEKPKLPVWPFFAADVLLVATAGVIAARAHHPWLWWEALVIVVTMGAAAGSLILPFLRQASADTVASHAELLERAAAELEKAEQIAAQFATNAAQWANYQEQAARSAASTAALAETIAAGTATLNDSLRKGADAEKNHLRTEIEKLRRNDGDWLHVIVHILDHVYALYQAARHSSQPGLAEQIANFQTSCREAARRMGLVAAVANAGEAFDPKVHQLPNNAAAPESALIAETLATGYVYQGHLLRRALVSLQQARTD